MRKNPDKVLKPYYAKTITFTPDAAIDLELIAEKTKASNVSIVVRGLIHKEAAKLKKGKKDV